MSFDDYRPTTTFAGDNPFANTSKDTVMAIPKIPSKPQNVAKRTGHSHRGNLPQFEICSDPIVPRRAPDGMYQKILKSLKPGDCIKCSMDDVGRISNALREHVASKMPECCIKSTRDYGDGMGRVWLIKREK